MEEVVQDITPHFELLDQMQVNLDQSYGAVQDANLKVLVVATKSSICSLQNGLKLKCTEQVVQLARDGNLDGAVKTLHKFFPNLKNSITLHILRVLYVDEKDLRVTIGFVERLRVEFHQMAFRALYEIVILRKHTEMLEILLLQKILTNNYGDGNSSDVLKRVDEDCFKIVDRVVEGIRAKDYTLSMKIVETLGSSILEGKMAEIVEKVHSTGTLIDTLLLINFSQMLPEISNNCFLILKHYMTC